MSWPEWVLAILLIAWTAAATLAVVLSCIVLGPAILELRKDHIVSAMEGVFLRMFWLGRVSLSPSG